MIEYMIFINTCITWFSAGIFMKAKGLAIITVIKAGFLVTARGGSGIVIAKLDDSITSGE